MKKEISSLCIVLAIIIETMQLTANPA